MRESYLLIEVVCSPSDERTIGLKEVFPTYHSRPFTQVFSWSCKAAPRGLMESIDVFYFIDFALYDERKSFARMVLAY